MIKRLTVFLVFEAHVAGERVEALDKYQERANKVVREIASLYQRGERAWNARQVQPAQTPDH
jgi:hypothetical protein